MDEELRALESAAQQNPGDRSAAERYEAALLRAGEREQVRQRYEFKFACPMTWSEFEPTGDPNVAHCAKCDRSIHYVADEAALADRVAAGDCVAVDPVKLASVMDGLIEHPNYHSASEDSAFCVTGTTPADARPHAIPGGVRPVPPPHPPPLAGAPLRVPPPTEPLTGTPRRVPGPGLLERVRRWFKGE